MDFQLSEHASIELERRGIPYAAVAQVVLTPEQIVDEYGGRKAYQSQVNIGTDKLYLLRVIVQEDTVPMTVVTVYRTSKIQKYWRTP